MTQIVLPKTLTAGTPENVNDLNLNLFALRDAINGSVDSGNLSAAAAAILGLTATDGPSPAVRRGKSIIAAEESRTNTAYGTLTTPDNVSNVVLATDGLLFVAYQAMWKNSVANTGRAAIFLGANQLKVAAYFGAAPVTQAAPCGDDDGGAGFYEPLFSFWGGLASADSHHGTNTPDDVTTGQAIGFSYAGGSTQPQVELGGSVKKLINSGGVDLPGQYGGFCTIFAAAGTYNVSVMFKSSSGSVSAKNRKLWVWTAGF